MGKDSKMGFLEFVLKAFAIFILLALLFKGFAQIMDNAKAYNQSKTETTKSK
jgi:hypothetical protein